VSIHSIGMIRVFRISVPRFKRSVGRHGFPRRVSVLC